MPDKLLSELTAATLPLSSTALVPVDTGGAELQRAPVSAFTGLTGPQGIQGIQGLTGPAGQFDIQQFTTSGTWTKPAGCKFVQILLIAGGQGGGSGRQGAAGTQRTGGNGGQGGEIVLCTVQAANLGATEAVVFGGGTGAGGASVTTPDTNGNAGQTGQTVQFGALLTGLYTATGGLGGGVANSSSSANGISVINGISVSSVSHGGGSTSAVTANAGTITGGGVPGSGGAGGTISAANAVVLAGLQKIPNLGNLVTPVTVPAACTEGQTGEAGKTFSNWLCLSLGVPIGFGGAGGGAGNTMAAGAGGNGGPAGSYGGGGAGGGASTNGFASGKGGDGGPAIAIIIAY